MKEEFLKDSSIIISTETKEEGAEEDLQLPEVCLPSENDSLTFFAEKLNFIKNKFSHISDYKDRVFLSLGAISLLAGSFMVHEFLDKDSEDLVDTKQNIDTENIHRPLVFSLGDFVMQLEDDKIDESLVDQQFQSYDEFNLLFEDTKKSVEPVIDPVVNTPIVDSEAFVLPVIEGEAQEEAEISETVEYEEDTVENTPTTVINTISINRNIVDRQLSDTGKNTNSDRNYRTSYTPSQSSSSVVQRSVRASSEINPNYDLTNQQQNWLRQANISVSSWGYVDYIITRESNWRPFVWNQQGSSAYGLCQSMQSIWKDTWADDFMTNPVSQLKWCNWYAFNRYGSWQKAYEFWKQNHWW